MWSYYGSKANIVKLYPPPRHYKIIEPFAGSARYSLQYFEKDVLLVDKYEVVVKIWKWLQLCSENDVLKLPRSVKYGTKLDDIKFDCEEARLFFGFVMGSGAERPRLTAGYRKTRDRPNHINYNLKKIAAQLYKIRHWKIEFGSYENIPDQEATWFIDPPYEFGGAAYPVGNKNLDFGDLAKWSRDRSGQVIVCENTKATWMDFKPLITQRGSMNTTTEAIWCNHATAYDNEQGKLF